MTLQRIQQVTLLTLAILPGILGWLVSSRQRPFVLPALRAEGFAKKQTTNDSKEANNNGNNKNANKPIYSQPALYDLAFGYRDFEEEVNFLWQRHLDVSGQTPRRILELAAGPARHAQTALTLHGDNNNIEAVHCVDSSSDMMDYASDLVQRELSVEDQEKFHYHVADMRNFVLPDDDDEKIDTAWILLGSLQHMNTNDDVRQCLSAVHSCLTADGTLIVELPHPRETFSMVECTRNGWKVPLQDEQEESAGELSIIWGDDDDVFDEITQVRQFTVRMSLTGASSSPPSPSNNENITLQEVVPLRLFTAQEMEALAVATNFRVASMHGALEEGVTANDEDAAYRLVIVFQKV